MEDSKKIAQAMVNTLTGVKRRYEGYTALTRAQQKTLRRINGAIKELVVIKGGKYYQGGSNGN